MSELRIVNVPQDLIDKIDSLFKGSKYPDRSAFLVAALKDYCLYHDQYFMHCLPDTIRVLTEDVIKKQSKKEQDLLEFALQTTKQSNNLMEQLMDVLAGEDNENYDESIDDE